MHSRLLTAPLRLGSRLPLAHVGCVVAGDAVRRHSAARRRAFEMLAVAATGTLAARCATERELVREGHDRDTIAPGSFHARVMQTEERARREITSLLTAFGVAVHLPTLTERWIADAARVAFVRLHDEGVIVSEEGLVERCPRCAATVDVDDVALVDQETEAFVLRFPFVDRAGTVEVRFDDLELLGAVVAVVVPPGAPTGEVAVPVVGRRVPVVALRDVDEPVALVPGHDRRSAELANRIGERPVSAVDPTGTVHSDGPLRGLARQAARVLAAEVAEAERAVASRSHVVMTSRRCAHCSTELMRSLAEGWFLRMSRLATAVPDAVREGDVTVRPASFRDELVGADLADWPVALPGGEGVPAPVARCEHCGNVAVGTSDDYVCRRCAGTLVAEDAALAPRFVTSVWPLASAGWPVHEARIREVYARTAVLVPSDDVRGWVLPSAALSLRLVGATPFSQVAVHPDPPDGPPPEDPIVARIGLIAGTDWERAAETAAALEGTSGPAIDLNALATTVRGALEDVVPADAGAALVAALGSGLDAGQAAAIANIARPVVGR